MQKLILNNKRNKNFTKFASSWAFLGWFVGKSVFVVEVVMLKANKKLLLTITEREVYVLTLFYPATKITAAVCKRVIESFFFFLVLYWRRNSKVSIIERTSDKKIRSYRISIKMNHNNSQQISSSKCKRHSLSLFCYYVVMMQ